MKTKPPKLTRWRKGPPPMIGEYIASVGRNDEFRRWWDGADWSLAYRETDSAGVKRRMRRVRGKRPSADGIEWRGLAEKPKNFLKPKPLGPL